MNNSKEILIVDDSNTNIVLIEAILIEKGYTIKTAFSAEEAQKRIDNNIPDLILLDLNMPKTNGYELLKNLKKNDKTKKIPIIIVSANTDASMKLEAKKEGAFDFIDKPVSIDVLEKKVTKVLSN